MGGHVSGAHQALVMTTVVHMHAAAHRAYHGPRGSSNRLTHFVTLILPRLDRLLVRADFKTGLLKLASGKRHLIVHDGDDYNDGHDNSDDEDYDYDDYVCCLVDTVYTILENLHVLRLEFALWSLHDRSRDSMLGARPRRPSAQNICSPCLLRHAQLLQVRRPVLVHPRHR